MEQDICLFSMNRYVGRTTVSHWVRRSCDILLVFIFRVRLVGAGLDSRLFAQIGIGDRKLGILHGLHEVFIDVFNLHSTTRRRICNWLRGASLGSFSLHMRVGFGLAQPLLSVLLFKSGISFLFVSVETLHECLDVRNLVLAAIVASGGML